VQALSDELVRSSAVKQELIADLDRVQAGSARRSARCRRPRISWRGRRTCSSSRAAPNADGVQ
jgi:hypothetical protein